MAEKQWTGAFTRAEFLKRAEEHEQSAEKGLRIGPNVSYVRTFQACAAAFRIAAEYIEDPTHMGRQ